ncbi:MAG: ATP-binding cassette domain-containing protein [Spirochaetaceae bacterium]|jgi:putative ABC transport system ATP-binding protein|nr:ATP-binding cassette domain-containing protein [Spirochaetaceae bacterium]
MLRITEAWKTFGAGTPDAMPVLGGLNLHLERGDFVTIIGSNGAGKSTLFNAIAGSVLLDRGRISLDGEDITWLREHRRARSMGRLFQDPRMGTAPDLTIEENLALVYSRGTGRPPLALALKRKERGLFAEALARLDMGLETRLKVRVGALSGGQRQALTLLLAVMIPPKLLLLDEHTAALDPVAAKKVQALTSEIAGGKEILPGGRQGGPITTLMITHSIPAALELGTRTVMMHRGRIVMDLSGGERSALSAEELLERYRETIREEPALEHIIPGA